MQYGEIVNLGRHKLMCGDATRHEDVAKLFGNDRARILFTSPPYSDLRTYNNANCDVKYLAEFIPACKDFCDVQCVNLGIIRRNHEVQQYWDEYINAAKKCGLKLLCWNVWDKLNPGSIAQQQCMFPIRHEFIFVFGEKPLQPNRIISKHCKGDRRQYATRRQKDGSVKITSRNLQLQEAFKPLESVVVFHPYKKRPTIHPAQMPLSLPKEYIKALTQENDIILDCFGGSGTTLIACEQTGRTCFMMEISPNYCDIIRERYEKLTGIGQLKFFTEDN